MNGLWQRVEQHGEPFFWERWIHMKIGIHILSVGTLSMDQIRLQDVPVLLEPIHPLLHHLFCRVGVVKARSAPAGLNTPPEGIGEVKLVFVQMVLERFESRGISAALILSQWDEHPAHAWSFVPGAIENILPGVDQLLRSRK